MAAEQASIVIRPAESRIVVAGKDLASCCRAIQVYGEASEMPRLTLDLQLDEITVEGQVRVSIPPASHEALIALGWTPPAGKVDG